MELVGCIAFSVLSLTALLVLHARLIRLQIVWGLMVIKKLGRTKVQSSRKQGSPHTHFINCFWVCFFLKGLIQAKCSLQKLQPWINNVFYHNFKSMNILHVLTVSCFANSLLIQSLFWQKPWSLHTSKNEVVLHLGKRTGFIWNGEACAKYIFLVIQGENEPIPCSEICINSLFRLDLLQDVYEQSWILLSDLHFSSGDLQTTTMCTGCAALFFWGNMLCFLSLYDGRRD